MRQFFDYGDVRDAVNSQMELQRKQVSANVKVSLLYTRTAIRTCVRMTEKLDKPYKSDGAAINHAKNRRSPTTETASAAPVSTGGGFGGFMEELQFLVTG